MNPEGACWDTVISKDLLWSVTVSVGDWEHSAGGRPQLVRTVVWTKRRCF